MGDPAGRVAEALALREELGRAIVVAQMAHTGQVRKDGSPYIEHPFRVAERLRGMGTGIFSAALLHDVVEDSEWTLDDLRELFRPRVVDCVDALTRRDGESYRDYIERLALDEWAKAIKLADIADNSNPTTMGEAMSRGHDLSGLCRRYRDARHYLANGEWPTKGTANG